jgi:hypothetical protein
MGEAELTGEEDGKGSFWVRTGWQPHRGRWRVAPACRGEWTTEYGASLAAAAWRRARGGVPDSVALLDLGRREPGRTAGTRPGGVDGRSLAGGRPGRVGIRGGGARVRSAGEGNRERKIVHGEWRASRWFYQVLKFCGASTRGMRHRIYFLFLNILVIRCIHVHTQNMCISFCSFFSNMCIYFCSFLSNTHMCIHTKLKVSITHTCAYTKKSWSHTHVHT